MLNAEDRLTGAGYTDIDINSGIASIPSLVTLDVVCSISTRSANTLHLQLSKVVPRHYGMSLSLAQQR